MACVNIGVVVALTWGLDLAPGQIARTLGATVVGEVLVWAMCTPIGMIVVRWARSMPLALGACIVAYLIMRPQTVTGMNEVPVTAQVAIAWVTPPAWAHQLALTLGDIAPGWLESAPTLLLVAMTAVFIVLAWITAILSTRKLFSRIHLAEDAAPAGGDRTARREARRFA
ncbi:hypothetical protein H8R18_06790 [Nanchangia anserum]|nr:hypothetical protein [Nanchangia anserum]QOX81460.1 hypothetical protein H8R18_06790 [Nanchangia anserum]